MAQAIVHRSRTKLRSAIGDVKNMMCCHFTGDLREMMKVLEIIEPVLEDAERHSLWDDAAREWLRRVRNAAYGISDIVDELQDTKARKMAGIMSLPKRNPMADRMEEMKLELRMLQESHRFASMANVSIGVQQQKPPPPPAPYPPPPPYAPPPPPLSSLPLLSLPPPPPPRTLPPPPSPPFKHGSVHQSMPMPRVLPPSRKKPPLPPKKAHPSVVHILPQRPPNTRVSGSTIHAIVDEQSIVGRGENKQMIMAALSAIDVTDGPIILPIFGLAAIGKTTMASMVFRDTGFGEYKYRIWVDVTPKFDLPAIGNYIISNVLQVINLEKESQRDHRPYWHNKVSEEEINTDTETDTDTDGSSQESEQEINQVTTRNFQEVEETREASYGASQASEDAIKKTSDEASQIIQEEINKTSDGTSEDEINKGSNGVSQVLAEEINKTSDGTSEDEINKGSDGVSQVLAEEINKTSDRISAVLEDQGINNGIDGTPQVTSGSIKSISQGTDEIFEVFNHGSHVVSRIPEEQTEDGSDETSHASEEEINQCSDGMSPVTEEEIHQDVDYITKRLHELLNGMKALIVLDDLWEEDSNELERLKCMLGVGIKGNKVTVIVTTCNEGIARKVCTVKPYKLDPLTSDMCWTIIKQQSGFGNRFVSDDQELERIGREIASKCGGLPLAAQEVGRSLCYRVDRLRWEDAMKSDIWSHIRSDNGIIRSLELSYRSLPPDLRLCFAYCAILPQGDNIVKDDIIHQWIALGLVDPSDTLSMTQVAEDYIRRLLDISFLQITASTSGNGDAGAILLTMHQLAHALARSVGDELIVLDDRMGTSYQDKCCRYALLTDFGVKLYSKLPTQLRALRCVGCSKMDLGNDAFSLARCLRVLHLNECSMRKLPDSICQLRQLGYLNLSGCSQLATLPESFGDILNLWYINLSRCYGLAELPESFGKLQKLVYLDLSFWCCFEGIRVLGGLSSLQHLNLSHPCCHLAQHRPYLEGLKDVLCKLTNLQYLNLSMCTNPIFCYLTEDQCREYIQLCTSGLSSLRHLDLSHNIFLVDLPESLGELHKLHTLDLTGCIRLKSVAKRICERDSLMVIVIRNCRDLKSCAFVCRTDDGAFSSNLVQLEEVNCQDLEIACLEQVKSTGEARRIRLVEKRKVEQLKLCWTVSSEGSVEDDANLLAELEPPHDLQRLELHGYKATCLPAWALSISSHLPNLMEVTMEDFPRCSSLPPFALLPNLQRLVLRRMAGIRRIDAGDLSSSCNKEAALHPLSSFTIDDMENLEEFNTAYYCGSGDELIMFPAIDELVIQKCPKLSFGSLPPRARRLEISDCGKVMSSRRLLVSDCDQMPKTNTSAGGGGGVEAPCTAHAPVTELVVHGCIADWSLLPYLAGLQMLSISNCEGMTSLPQDMGHLNTLLELQIVCCKQLRCFPDSMQHLTSLHSMHFTECDSIKKLPEWFGCLTSLQKLTVHKCPKFKSFPRSIKGLINLKDLQISECQKLMNWCELAKNKKKLGHIQPKFKGNAPPPPSLPRAGPSDTWDYFFSMELRQGKASGAQQ